MIRIIACIIALALCLLGLFLHTRDYRKYQKQHKMIEETKDQSHPEIVSRKYYGDDDSRAE